MQTINVRTTQNVFIEYPIASLGDRVVAALIDMAILVVYFFVFTGTIVYLEVSSDVVYVLGYVLPSLLYVLLFQLVNDIFRSPHGKCKYRPRWILVSLRNKWSSIDYKQILTIMRLVEFIYC